MDKDVARSVVYNWVDAWNAYDIEKIRGFYSADVEFYQAPAKVTLTGTDPILHRFRDFYEALEVAKMTILNISVSGDTIILENNIFGINTGKFLKFQPTNHRLDIDTCDIFKITDAGIVKHTTYLDTATVLRVLELIEVPGTKAEAA